MQVFKHILDIQAFIGDAKLLNKKIGFVPTMGALHEGHLSLIERASKECDIVIMSIFINPTQFNNQEDFDKYPRTLAQDLELLKSVPCDVVFTPTVTEMYENPLLEVAPLNIGYLDTVLEGSRRPGHYAGVVMIVEKLLKAVSPDAIYMGLKDYQQVKVIDHLIKTKELPIQLVGCHTLREPNGVAMSSRNMRLSAAGKETAGQIYKALSYIRENKGSISPNELCVMAIHQFLPKPPFEMEYLEIRHAHDLSGLESDQWQEDIDYVVLIAAWLEGVRLIDNLEL